MEATFLTAVHIQKVRHLGNIDIPLSTEVRKNLILTGKNGSGKTSVLEALVASLDYAVSSNFLLDKKIERMRSPIRETVTEKEFIDSLPVGKSGAEFNLTSVSEMRQMYQAGNFILAYYGDKRNVMVEISKNIVKVDLKQVYNLRDAPSRELVKYLVNLKTTQAFAQVQKNFVRLQEIEAWFDRFQNILRRIYADNSLTLEFDIDTFQFTIHQGNREPFDFNTMSMGYAAVFDIIGDLIMRMETKTRGNYDLQGIVLIDEIETHLHVELQKEIVPILTGLFPNIQFIFTTHSPFVLNSAQNAVIFDLETHKCVEDGLTNLPYEGIVEGYFGADRLSQELKEKFERYRQLANKQELSNADYAELAELELYLDEIPDYLALDLTTEYERLKQMLNSRG